VRGHERLGGETLDRVEQAQVLADRSRVDAKHCQLVGELRLVDLRLRDRVPHHLGRREAARGNQGVPPALPAGLGSQQQLGGGIRVRLEITHVEVGAKSLVHVFGAHAQIHVAVEPLLVDLFRLAVGVVIRVLGRGLAPDDQWHLLLDRNPHGIREDSCMAMPAEVTLLEEGLKHQTPHHFPFRGERKKVGAESPERALHVVVQVGPKEPGVKAHDERLEPVLLDQVVQRSGAVLAAAERHDAVVVGLAAMRGDECVEFTLGAHPVHAVPLHFLLTADVTDALFVERDGLMSLWKIALRATPHGKNCNRGSR